MRLGVVLCLSFAAVACSPRGPSLLAVQDVVGCYDLRLVDWENHSPEDSLRFKNFLPPPRVEFRADLAYPPEPGRYVVTSAPGSRSSPHRITGWEIQGDSVFAGWSAPGDFEGVFVKLGFGAGELRGYATPFTDADSHPRSIIPAVATPIACDARPRIPLGAGQFVPRAVGLADGVSLRLASSLPDSGALLQSEDRRNWTIAARPTGLFAGPDRVQARLSREGSIRSLKMEFPSTLDPEAILARLEQALGPGRTTRVGERGLATWADWTTRLDLRWGDWGFFAELVDTRMWD